MTTDELKIYLKKIVITGSIWEILHELQKLLQAENISNSRLEAELLVSHVLQLERVQLYTHSNQVLSKEEIQKIKEIFKRRSSGEPMAYLIGTKEFFSLSLQVNSSVLIPRPETELLVEVALAELSHLQAHVFPGQTLCVVDVGTGSGAIALALQTHHQNAWVVAVDKSEQALSVAQKNASVFGLSLSFVRSDLLRSFSQGSFHMIVSNPPYIPTRELAFLQKEVQKEPFLALDGGADGLQIIRILMGQAFSVLKPQGVLMIEIGFGQALDVEKLMRESGFLEIQTYLDFAEIPRVLVGKKGKE